MMYDDKMYRIIRALGDKNDGEALMESVMDAKHYIEDLPEGTKLYNAPKTTDDVVESEDGNYHNMIRLWEKATGETAYCKNKNCNGSGDVEDIVGGHFVTKPVYKLKKGDKVYIVPSCKSCNHPTNKDPFVLCEDTKAVVVKWDK
ncbi:MAG: hypothetical protein IKN12_12755 [Selenomonadaceae bacterium]|nr:hypothetical protein [Selenomonadaceae bacterium]